MNKLTTAFADKKALAAFIMAGDPTPQASEGVMQAALRGGADLLVIGLPFSDPTAEGPALQAANLRALAAGTGTEQAFLLAQASPVPVVLYSYLNPVLRYGYDAFFTRCAETGVSAVILPDLPYEEENEVAPAAKAHGVAVIRVITPVSGSRIPMLAAGAEGFIYAMGFTGPDELTAARDLIRAQSGLPIIVSGGDAAMAAAADGILVDAPIAEAVASGGETDAIPVLMGNMARRMRGNATAN